MLRGYRLMGFVPARDLERARAFYEGVLELRVQYQDEYALVCSGGGTTLRVQKVESFTPHPFTALGWTVPFIRKQIDQLVKRGVTFERFPYFEQDARGIWSPPSGALVAWFKDPDGNLLSLTEMKG